MSRVGRGRWSSGLSFLQHRPLHGSDHRTSATHYRKFLEEVVANPDQRVSEIEFLTEDERHKLLFEWNNTQHPITRDICVHHLFETQAAKTPSALAVEFAGEQLTYAELNERSNQLARHLRGLGVGPESLVGICIER